MKPSANLCLARNSFPDFDWIHSSHSSRLIFPSLFLSPLRAKEDAIYASWWRGSPVSSSSYNSCKNSNISNIMYWYFWKIIQLFQVIINTEYSYLPFWMNILSCEENSPIFWCQFEDYFVLCFRVHFQLPFWLF